MVDITMPRLSDTMEEGTIASWLKQPGDQVNRGDVVAQVETDKATMDLQAFESGVLQEILAPEGTTVAIGEPVARLGDGAGAAAPAQPAPTAEQAAPPAAAETGSEVPKTAEARANVAEAPEPTAQPAETPVLPASPEAAPAPAVESKAATGKVRASPLARRIAEEHELDLAKIQGTGPEGRVIRADVEAVLKAGPAAAPTAAPAQATPAAPPAEADEDVEPVRLTQMRKIIARRMTESTTTVPHFFLTATADATELVKLRKQVVAQQEAAGDDGKVSINDFMVKAVATALRQMPEVNVSYTDEALLQHKRVHVGIAVALENGLIVPVIRDTDQKSVGQIGREARELAARAREGKLQPAEYSGGTFSVSNLGMFGVEQFSAVINKPESGILAVGAITREPAEYQGEIALRERVKLTLSIDHRALDGATGARFLQKIKQLLEQPMLLLI